MYLYQNITDKLVEIYKYLGKKSGKNVSRSLPVIINDVNIGPTASR
jgi:hypothetical protein